jgi:hypothetical protein
MKFELKQTIAGTVAEVEQTLADPRYPPYLLEHHGVLLELQPLEVHQDGPLLRRKVRYRPKPVIGSVGPKKIPPEWFAFIESSTYDPAQRALTFSNVPTTGGISNMLENTGTMRLREVGGRTERELKGEIRIKVPFLLRPLGAIAERLIQAEGIKLLEGEVRVLDRFIAEVLRAKA